jgi:hypothetical protein
MCLFFRGHLRVDGPITVTEVYEGVSVSAHQLRCSRGCRLVWYERIVWLCGCPTYEQELSHADHGTAISQEDAQSQAAVFPKRRFQEPESTEIHCGPIHNG